MAARRAWAPAAVLRAVLRARLPVMHSGELRLRPLSFCLRLSDVVECSALADMSPESTPEKPLPRVQQRGPAAAAAPVPVSAPEPEVPPPPKSLSEEEALRASEQLIEEYMDTQLYEEAARCVSEIQPPALRSKVVESGLRWMLEQHDKEREQLADLFDRLGKDGKLTENHFAEGCVFLPSVCLYSNTVRGQVHAHYRRAGGSCDRLPQPAAVPVAVCCAHAGEQVDATRIPARHYGRGRGQRARGQVAGARPEPHCQGIGMRLPAVALYRE